MIEPPLKLWEHQTRIVRLTEEILREQTSLLVASPTGSGKCHPAGTMILMYDGSLKAVESIVPGDQLMAPDSRPRKVKSTSTGYGQGNRVLIAPRFGTVALWGLTSPGSLSIFTCYSQNGWENIGISTIR